MRKQCGLLSALLTIALVSLMGVSPATGDASAQVVILDRSLTPTAQITDGDELRLRVRLPDRVNEPTAVTFALDTPATRIASCTIQVGSDTCQSEATLSLGWFWDQQGRPIPRRRVLAVSSALAETPSATLTVAPRPVVLVHGLNSTAAAWANYLGPQGFLASIGLHGYAVGDGQVEGTLNTGSLSAPIQRTLTVAQNAAILATYIANVKRVTGAQQVDLVTHSLGGLISRYYIAQLMTTRDVAQLITLGSPHAGTECGNLPAALGFYHPATLEIRPGYMRDIFNRQITRRAGVPFYVLAGTRIFDAIQSPCTSVPNDLVVAAQSVSAIQAPTTHVPVLHLDMNSSPQVFTDFVKPHLLKSVGEFPNEPDPPPDLSPQPALQFTRILTGHVAVGSSVTHVVNIDRVTVASFALFDATQSLTVTVRGASGAIIPLSPVTNGLIMVNDPETLVYLGYGFRNPRPGPWEISLRSTASTPSQGADYALMAHLTGGATLQAQSSILLPQLGEIVVVSARLELAGQTLPIETANAVIRAPDGRVEPLHLTPQDAEYRATWRPTTPGLYTIDLVMTGVTPDGMTIERSAYLAVEAQPLMSALSQRQGLLAAGIILGLLVMVAAWGIKQARRSGSLIEDTNRYRTQ